MGIKIKRAKNCNKKILKIFYKSREKVIKLFNEYSKITSIAKYRSIHRKGLRILNPEQMLQRLPIALAQVKARNASNYFLNEIRKIIYIFVSSKGNY